MHVKGGIIGVRTQMSQYNLLFGLKLCEKISKITDSFSRTLQKQSLSAVQAQIIADLTVKSMRTDEALKNNTAEPSLPRKRKAPKCHEIGDGESYHSPTVLE